MNDVTVLASLDFVLALAVLALAIVITRVGRIQK
jgi:hypothetical protein